MFSPHPGKLIYPQGGIEFKGEQNPSNFVGKEKEQF